MRHITIIGLRFVDAIRVYARYKPARLVLCTADRWRRVPRDAVWMLHRHVARDTLPTDFDVHPFGLTRSVSFTLDVALSDGEVITGVVVNSYPALIGDASLLDARVLSSIQNAR